MTKQSRSWNPRSYQKVGVKKMISQACLGLFMKPGRGKTSVVYMAIRILQDAGYVKKSLVICPIRPMYRVWPHQKDDYDEFKHLKVNILHGSDKEAMLKDDSADIYVVNPEGLDWLFGAKVVKTDKGNKIVLDPARTAYVTSKFQLLVVDESSKFKAYNTNRFKLIKQVVPKFRRRVIMTGSLVPKGLMGLFGQVYMLDEGASLGKFITHYREKFFYPDGYGGYDWQPIPGAREKIIEKMGPLAFVVDDDPPDLPRLMYDDKWIDLPPAVADIYKKMEDKLMAELESGTIVAANAAVAAGKCRQIANGGLYEQQIVNEEKLQVFRPLHTLKYDALEDLMEELEGSPLLITYEFDFDAQWLAKKKIPNLSRLSAKECDAVIEKFSRGELLAVAGHPQSISLGIDGLQHACEDIAMLGVNWSLENYQQVIERVRRSGNPNAVVTVHRILARNTVDETVLEVLEQRDEQQVDFMSALRRASDS